MVTTDRADCGDQLWWAVSLQRGGCRLKNYCSLRCVIVRGGRPGNGAVVGGCDKNFADQLDLVAVRVAGGAVPSADDAAPPASAGRPRGMELSRDEGVRGARKRSTVL
ncbi:hypothetical protein [Kitasatospora sp. NPDC056184]|uniref:hypothetical protein n=1 Tax=Kitasatospora sp. NPDC056184 TaxID=3345738 RepID=UPI0035DF6844